MRILTIYSWSNPDGTTNQKSQWMDYGNNINLLENDMLIFAKALQSKKAELQGNLTKPKDNNIIPTELTIEEQVNYHLDALNKLRNNNI